MHRQDHYTAEQSLIYDGFPHALVDGIGDQIFYAASGQA